MRVLVCRALADGASTARALTALGHEPILAPVLTIVPVPVAVPATPLDALLLTSAHGLAGLGEADAGSLSLRPAYAVGGQTAAALRGRGFADVRIGTGNGAALVDLLRLTLPAPARLLYLAGRVHKPALPEALTRGGYGVVTLASYDAREVDAWPDAVVSRLRTGAIDACLHFSRRSAALALAMSRRADASVSFGRLRHLCLSADVASPLLESGCSTLLIADRPDEASLLQALGATI